METAHLQSANSSAGESDSKKVKGSNVITLSKAEELTGLNVLPHARHLAKILAKMREYRRFTQP